MRRLTLGLLGATYLCVSLTIALTLWRNGGGWGAGVAALMGSLGLAFAFHGLIARAFDTAIAKVLAEAGRNADSHFNRVYEYRDRMPVFALAFLYFSTFRHLGFQVEDEGTLEMLEAMHCDKAQGHLFGAAVRARELEAVEGVRYAQARAPGRPVRRRAEKFPFP